MAPKEIEYIKYREYAGRRWLCSPSESLILCFSAIQDINNCIIKHCLFKDNIAQLIKTIILIYIDFDCIECEIHKEKLIDYLLNVTCRFFINKYCKNLNQILSGRRDSEENVRTNFKTRQKNIFVSVLKGQ